MEKTSIEYAEKLALDLLIQAKEDGVSFDEFDYVEGYLKAVEETNVKELREALNKY